MQKIIFKTYPYKIKLLKHFNLTKMLTSLTLNKLS